MIQSNPKIMSNWNRKNPIFYFQAKRPLKPFYALGIFPLEIWTAGVEVIPTGFWPYERMNHWVNASFEQQMKLFMVLEF
jgi:hypothetical protein